MPTAAYIDVTDATFAADVLERSKSVPVVVDFWAPWCGPCRVLGPIIERIAANHGDEVVLAKLNTDENPRVATQFRIQGIPAVKAFKDGKVVSEFTGAIPEPQVMAFFNKLVPSPSDRAASEAARLAAAGDYAAAESIFRRVLAGQPSNADAIVGLGEILFARGTTDELGPLLDKIPGDRRAKALKHRIFLKGFAEKHAKEDLAGEAAAAPRDARARYRYGLLLAARGQYEAALDELLDSIRADRKFADEAARKAVLGVFDILGPDDPRTRQYQRNLASVLF